MNILSKDTLSIEQKINLMKEDAKYDVVDAKLSYGQQFSDEESIPDPTIFQNIHSKKTPPKVPKVFMSNNCSFNCAYCGCRASRDNCQRYINTPREIAEIAINEAKKNGYGIFLTSAIYKNANYTQELMIEALKIMRKEFFYNGYIHAKVMPGTDGALIEQTGRYANRLSVNIEVAQNRGYEQIAKQKNKENILLPMLQISSLIKENGSYGGRYGIPFANSQTTQLMAGSTKESDRTIMTLSKALYKKYNLKRVYYTAFQYKNPAKGYDLESVTTPLWRVRRLYQADRLIQLYGFSPDEITPSEEPDLKEDMDPKIAWAIRNIHLFPIEVNTADYEMLLRIPGIGIVYAKKIIEARRYGKITHQGLKKMGVSLKKSNYFITCNGLYEGGFFIDYPELLYKMFSEQENV